MRIGTIGAGNVAQSFARKAVAAGHEVALSNRSGPRALAELVRELAPKVSVTTPEEAATHDIVLLAVPWLKAEASLRSLPAWRGQILIDATNGFGEHGVIDFGDDSSSERIARIAEGARVVKAINAMFMENFEQEPARDGLRRALFISGDDTAANAEIADLFESFGYAPILLGSLKTGGRMQAIGATLAGHDLYLPWPAPRSFPAFNGETGFAG